MLYTLEDTASHCDNVIYTLFGKSPVRRETARMPKYVYTSSVSTAS
jgi:hypothetical protein